MHAASQHYATGSTPGASPGRAQVVFALCSTLAFGHAIKYRALALAYDHNDDAAEAGGDGGARGGGSGGGGGAGAGPLGQGEDARAASLVVPAACVVAAAAAAALLRTVSGTAASQQRLLPKDPGPEARARLDVAAARVSAALLDLYGPLPIVGRHQPHGSRQPADGSGDFASSGPLSAAQLAAAAAVLMTSAPLLCGVPGGCGISQQHGGGSAGGGAGGAQPLLWDHVCSLHSKLAGSPTGRRYLGAVPLEVCALMLDLLHVDPAFRGVLVRGGQMLAAAVLAATFTLVARQLGRGGKGPDGGDGAARGNDDSRDPTYVCLDSSSGWGCGIVNGASSVPGLPFLPVLSDLASLPPAVLCAAVEGVLAAVLQVQVEERPPDCNPLRQH